MHHTRGTSRGRLRRSLAAVAIYIIFFSYLFPGRGALSVSAAASDREAKEELLFSYAEQIAEDKEKLKDMIREREILAVVYPKLSVNVYEGASEKSAVIDTLNIGSSVMIRDLTLEPTEDADRFGKLWNQVCYYIGDTLYQGYIEQDNLLSSDERYLAWKENAMLTALSQMQFGKRMLRTSRGNLQGSNSVSAGDASVSDNDLTGYEDIDLFPVSYRPELVRLKQSHPTWMFVPYVTGIKWQDAVANEIDGGKSLVHKSLPDCMKEGTYDEGNWFYASKEALEYYMDPRNGLTEERIFQFELLSYNASCQTYDALEQFLNNTFMAQANGNAPGTVMSYTHIIWATGAEMGVSPFHLAARIYQEQGRGTSPLISGTVPGYEGYYNYFNIKASGKTQEEIVRNGLNYAKENGWAGAYYSIYGGAGVISGNYIQRQQDTLYLQKFNVSPNSTYWHQYMQNISAPTTEAASIKKLYAQADALESPFLFRIPVFEDMPGEACARPERSLNVVITPPEGFSGEVWLDGVAVNGIARNGELIVPAPDADRTNAVMYRYNENGVPVGMSVWTLSWQNQTYMETLQPEMEDLLTYHGFSIRITGKAGIRFKTGISKELKDKLVTAGVNGYILKEYGTLVMTDANRSVYPMVRGGAKVASGLSYGTENGQKIDKVYETRDARQRFTSVLVGLPAAQYKTVFAFRGYAVLEKDGTEITVYGPVQARSIYSLAEQILGLGSYPAGSSADLFLKKLITDADAIS